MDIYHAVRSPGYLKLLLIAALLGAPISLLALVFIQLVHLGENFLWHDIPHWLGADRPPWWLLLLIPTLAGVLVALVRKLPGDGGHHPLGAMGPGGTPLVHVPSILLAALFSLSAGIVLGPEAPLIALGTGVAGAVGILVARGNTNGILILTLAGGFGAIAAIFGNPLAAAILLIESIGIGGPMLVTVMLPGLLSAGIGYLVFTGVGEWTGIHAPSLTIPILPPGGRPTWADMGWAIVVGVGCAVLMVLIRRCSGWVQSVGKGQSYFLAIPAVGFVVGLCAIAYSLLTGADPVDVLFSGQTQVGTLGAEATTLALGTLALLVVFKGIAYGVSLGSGFRGGPIFPALFLGAALGLIAGRLLPGMSPLAGFAAGMAAATAAQMRLPLSALVIVTLLCGTQGLQVLPIVIMAVVIGVVVRGLLDTEPPPALSESSEGPPSGSTDGTANGSPTPATA